MMIVPLTEEHLQTILDGERDPALAAVAAQAMMHEAATSMICARGFSGVVVNDEHRPMVAAGVLRHWAGRGECWMLVHRAATSAELAVATRACRARLDELQAHPDWRRIEMIIPADVRWAGTFANALGMRIEGVLRAWDIYGRDHLMCARVALAGGAA